MNIFNINPLSEIQKGIVKLNKLAYKHGTNKTPYFGHSYPNFYHYLFSGKTDNVNKVLQIGLGKVEENSLYFWKDFFPKAKIYGVGNDKKYVYKSGRIQTFLGERWDAKELHKILHKTGRDIDVVVDEGERSPQDILSSFQTLMPMFKKTTSYIIENTDSASANLITNSLKNYNVNVMRRHHMLSRSDRLIVITNKTA